MKKLLLVTLVPVVVALILEALVTLGIVPDYLLPKPSDILFALQQNPNEFIQASLSTLSSAAMGLAISFLLGLFSALIMASNRWLQEALYPYAVFFQTVPLIAVAPILVIWFGFGQPTVVAASVIASIFPIIANSSAGLQSVPRPLLDLFRLYGASDLRILFSLRLPSAVPHILTGLKIASGLAMIGAIVGEFIAGGGLGGLIDMSRTQQRLDRVFAAVLLASFLGSLLLRLSELLGGLFRREQPSERD